MTVRVPGTTTALSVSTREVEVPRVGSMKRGVLLATFAVLGIGSIVVAAVLLGGGAGRAGSAAPTQAAPVTSTRVTAKRGAPVATVEALP